MDPVVSGMYVLGVDGKRFGTVGQQYHCCVEVEDGSGSVFLTWDAVYNVSPGRLEIVCVATEALRYACLVHRPRAARSQSA